MSKPSNSFDGKWGREIRAQAEAEKAARERETVSNDTQKDSKAIHDLFSEFHYADNLGVIKSKLAEYVATVRREAFKDAQGMMDAPAAGTMASTEFRKGFESMRRLAKRVLERGALESTASKKEGRNGPTS